jgi:peptide/nickel transport system permease protein
MASLLAWVLGTLLGAVLGWRSRAKIITYLFPPLMMLSAAPYFIIGLLLLYCFAFRIPVFPSGGGYSEGTSPTLSAGFVLDVAWHAVLPALSIVLVSIATWAISMRALVVGFDGEDFLLFAEAKGLRSWTIFVRYALRNALLPQLTGLGIALGQIVSGAVLVEAVFHYPGLGGLLYRAILTRDFNLEQGVVLVIIVSIALAALAIDLAYPLIDPRVSAG